jgi:SAM-dependent methyltransferase
MESRLTDERVTTHYGRGDVAERIRAALIATGKDPEAFTREDLGSIDQLHGGGIEATRVLARLAGVKPGTHVLDIGSGLGGPARTLAAEFGATVVGIDLTEEFCDVATELSSAVGLADRVRFECASALALPFEDGAFEVAWSQNVLMNIEDKAAVLREVRRVLRPGGLFALQSVMAGSDEPYYPTPWADDASTSHLIGSDEFRVVAEAMGFEVSKWEPGPTPPPPAPGAAGGRQLFVAPDRMEPQRLSMQRNFEEARTTNLFAVLVRHL